MDALIKTVSQFAPLLGGVLGGAPGAAIGSIIAAKFGGDASNPSDLAAKIQADPEAASKLMAIQSNNSVELERIHMMMAENSMKYHSMTIDTEARDREGARQREIELAKAGVKDYTTSILAYLLTYAVFVSLAYLFISIVPEENKELIVSLINTLTTVWVGSMGFYFGSVSHKMK